MERIDPHSVAIGAAVRGAIAQANLTQAAYSELSGMALNTLSRRINGVLPFTWPEIAKVADITGMTIGEIVASAERIHLRSTEGPALRSVDKRAG